MSEGFVARGIYIAITESDGTKVSINTNNVTAIRDTLRGGSRIEFVGGIALYAEESMEKVTSMICGAINNA